jgi:hypothetical protein
MAGLSVSPDGTILMTGSGGSLATSAGTWTFGTATDAYGNSILLNGQPAGDGYSTELEVANSGHVYAGSNGQWWEWSGSSWSMSGDPSGSPSSPPPPPGGGRTLTVGQASNIPQSPMQSTPHKTATRSTFKQGPT